VRRGFGNTLQFEPSASTLGRGQRRSAYRKPSYVDSGRPGGGNPEATRRLHGAAVDDLVGKSVRPDAFIHADAIEALVRFRMGEAYAVVAAALAGAGRPEDAHAVRQLISRLAQRTFSFGDGPRWHIDHVSAILAAWATEFGYPIHQLAPMSLDSRSSVSYT
jgi:hypothetical protein